MALVPGLIGARQICLLNKEVITTPGTFDAAATIKPVIELIENSTPPITNKVTKRVERAGQGNRRRRFGPVLPKKGYTGTLKFRLDPIQAIDLIPWAVPVVSSGKLVLPTFSMDYFGDADSSRRFLGVYCEQMMLECSTDNPWVVVTCTLRAIDEAASPPVITDPAITAYPTLDPYQFEDSDGVVKIGSTIAAYRSIKLTIKNMTDPQYDEKFILNSNDYGGRDIDWEIALKNNTTTQRLAYEALTTQIGQIKFAITAPSAHNVTFDFQGRNAIDDRDVTTDWAKTQYQTLKMMALEDLTTGLDAVITAA